MEHFFNYITFLSMYHKSEIPTSLLEKKLQKYSILMGQH